jgi:hypothetical protein
MSTVMPVLHAGARGGATVWVRNCGNAVTAASNGGVQPICGVTEIILVALSVGCCWSPRYTVRASSVHQGK